MLLEHDSGLRENGCHQFEQKFKTNETLKQEISEQVDLVMRESTKELQDNFEGIVKQNERTLEQM